MRKPLVLCLLLSALLCFGNGGGDVDSVMKGYLSAVGGKDAIASLQSLHKEGTYVFNGLEHPMQVWHKGNKLRLEIEGLTTWGSEVVWGKMEIDVYDGETVKGVSPDVPEVSDKVRAADEVKASAYLISSLAWHHLNAKGTITSKGTTKIEGIPVHHLVLTRPDGVVEDWFLKTKTFLPFKVNTGGSDMFKPQAWVFDDYRKVGDYFFPFYVEIEEGLFTRTYLFKKMKLNPEIADDRFTL